MPMLHQCAKNRFEIHVNYLPDVKHLGCRVAYNADTKILTMHFLDDQDTTAYKMLRSSDSAGSVTVSVVNYSNAARPVRLTSYLLHRDAIKCSPPEYSWYMPAEDAPGTWEVIAYVNSVQVLASAEIDVIQQAYPDEPDIVTACKKYLDDIKARTDKHYTRYTSMGAPYA